MGVILAPPDRNPFNGVVLEFMVMHDAERLRVFTTIDAFFDHVESAIGEEDAWCRFEE